MDLVNVSFTSFDDLPEGVVIDILSRLPPKTIVQSTSVSKSWYSIIKNPFFKSIHLSRGFDHSNSYIFIVEPKSSSVTVISDNNHVLTRQHPNFIIPFQTRSQTYALIGTSNGLVCLTDHAREYHGGDIYLLNPFIKKYKKIDAESSCYQDLIELIDGDDTGMIRVCFWYCEVEKDYKIFRMLFRFHDENYIVVSRRFEIYSLNAGTWTVMEDMDGLDVYASCPMYVNGCLYWEPPWPKLKPLQCFDLKEKLFYNISLPSTLTQRTLQHNVIGFLAKEESVVLWYSTTPRLTIYLYVLEKGITGGWKKLFLHENHVFILDNSMGFTATGRFIFCKSNIRDKNIVAIDFDNPYAAETLTLDYEDVSLNSTVVFNVSESLVFF